MKRIILDTNYYAAFKKDESAAVNLLRRTDFIGINTVILGELLAGFRCGSREEMNRKELDDFLDSPRVNLLPIDDETAEFYAQVYHRTISGWRLPLCSMAWQ